MKNTVFAISLVLVIIGAINWLLIGIFNWGLVSAIFGSMSVMSRIIYILVGIAGIVTLGFAIKNRFRIDRD